MKYCSWTSIAQHMGAEMCRIIGASRADITVEETTSEQEQKENEKILIEIKESHKNSRRAYGSRGLSRI